MRDEALIERSRCTDMWIRRRRRRLTGLLLWCRGERTEKALPLGNQKRLSRLNSPRRRPPPAAEGSGAKMFFHIVLERNMQLHPRHFGPHLRDKLVSKLLKDVEGTCR